MTPLQPCNSIAEHTCKQRTQFAQCLEAHTRRHKFYPLTHLLNTSDLFHASQRNNYTGFIDPCHGHDGLISSFILSKWNHQRQNGARHPPPNPYLSSPPPLKIHHHHHHNSNKLSTKHHFPRDPPRHPLSRPPQDPAPPGSTPIPLPADNTPCPRGPRKTYPRRDQPAATKTQMSTPYRLLSSANTPLSATAVRRHHRQPLPRAQHDEPPRAPGMRRHGRPQGASAAALSAHSRRAARPPGRSLDPCPRLPPRMRRT